MKKLTLSFAVILLASSAFAADNYHQYCQNNENQITGISISENGKVTFLDSLAGAPNPFIANQVIDETDSQFSIAVYGPGKELREVLGPYLKLSKTQIQIEDQIFDSANCKQ